MKKSRHIHLVLITAALASCHKPANHWTNGNAVYLRSDSTAPYTRVSHQGVPGLWYYAFRPYGYYSFGAYRRVGYYSNAISESSNIGNNSAKSGIVRGGFGGSAEGGESASS
jgi:hypothetical protein